MKVLVVAEHWDGAVAPATFNVVCAAQEIASEIHVLIVGQGCSNEADLLARLEGVCRVRVVEAAHYVTQVVENVAMVVAQAASAYSHVLLPATSFGKDLAPRVAAMLDVAQVSDVVAVEAPDVFVRPLYTGNLLARVQSLEPVKVLTVRASAFASARLLDSPCAEIEAAPGGPDMGVSRVLDRASSVSGRADLACARVVVAGGRGLGTRENFHGLLGPLADRLGAALGATRAAVDANFVSNDLQIGQTGKIVAPDLYIAVGLSGSLQHLAGMRDSKVIVAINKDPEAPIFQVADYGLVGDLNTIVPAFTAGLGS